MSRSPHHPRPTPPPGTVLEVCSVRPPINSPMGGPRLCPIGRALVQPDQTITAWLDAVPVSGILVLRPCLGQTQVRMISEDADSLATIATVGQA